VAIPDFREDGWLPEGHWQPTWEEIEARLGGEPGRQRRLLMERLTEWRDSLRGFGISGTLILDGSFASAKERPGDIDAIFVSDVDSMEVIATEPRAARLLSYVHMKDLGFGDLFYFTETAVRDFPIFCRLDGFDIDSRTGKSKGVLRVRI
jgi:hypothetical protein